MTHPTPTAPTRNVFEQAYLALLRLPIGSPERMDCQGALCRLRDKTAEGRGISSEEAQNMFEEEAAKEAPTRAEIDEAIAFFDKTTLDVFEHFEVRYGTKTYSHIKTLIQAAKSGGARFTDPPEDTAEFVLVPRNRTKKMHDAMFNAMPDLLLLLSDTDSLWWAAIKAWLVKK